MTIDPTRPLNEYKIKASHNSYSNQPLSLWPSPKITRKILKAGYRAIEIDIHKIKRKKWIFFGKVTERLVVKHLWIFGRHKPLGDFLNKILEFNDEVKDFLVIAFDMKNPNIADDVAKAVLNKFEKRPLIRHHEIAKDDTENYIWPTL
ncbi:MAG: phosphatidylinositol-specific phospholipase C domain-containing protein, partial [Candidatus Kariarchaeaceae archaeon]